MVESNAVVMDKFEFDKRYLSILMALFGTFGKLMSSAKYWLASKSKNLLLETFWEWIATSENERYEFVFRKIVQLVWLSGFPKRLNFIREEKINVFKTTVFLKEKSINWGLLEESDRFKFRDK